MPAKVSFKPAGCQQVIPYLVIAEPEKTISLLKKAFGATESHISRDPQGRIMHASLSIGDSMIMIGGAGERFPAQAAMVYLYVPDIDSAYQRALAAGATSIMPPADQFYGDRSAGVKDANNIQFWIATHVEDVANDELERRAQAAFKGRAQAKAS